VQVKVRATKSAIDRLSRKQRLIQKFGLPPQLVERTIHLLAEGGTVELIEHGFVEALPITAADLLNDRVAVL
jgi:hypothetical protein